MSKYWSIEDPFYEKKFLEKNFTVPKKLKGGTLWDFPTSILSQNSKKIEGGNLWGNFFPEKSLTMPKKLKGGPFGLAWYGVMRENRKNLFGSVR